MRIRSIWALVSTWILFAAVPVSADPTAEPLASEQTGEGSAAGRDTPAVPLIGVSIDGALSSDIMEAAARGLGSPILRGNAIEKKLRLAKLPSGFDIESVEDSFSVGEEAFYKGDIEEASRRFLEIASLYTEKRETLAFYPSLRTAVFKARMHLAVIAHGRKKIDLFHRYLGEAAEIPEMEPSPEDFPPWVCDAFASDKMRAFAPSKAGGIRLASENGCMLSVLGRVVEHLEMQHIRSRAVRRQIESGAGSGDRNRQDCRFPSDDGSEHFPRKDGKGRCADGRLHLP